MEQTLKQRLVGAAVIIAIGVIVIPMLLDGSGERQLRKMPDAPKASRHSEAGLVTQEQVPVSRTSGSGQIVLTLPDEDAPPQAAVREKPPEPAVTNNPPEQLKPVTKSETPEPPKSEEKVADQQKDTTPEPEAKPVSKQDDNEADSTDTAKANDESADTTRPTDVWVVQVGSFTDAKKAFAYRDKLITKKYKAFVEKISGRSGQSLYRVRVGPMPKREQASNMEAKLEQQGIKGFVTRHP